MIVALRQAGDGDGSDAPGAFEDDREAAAVGGVVAEVEAGGFGECGFIFFMLEADGVGAAVVALNAVALTADPFEIVWRGAGHREGEELMAVETDVDGDGGVALFGGGFEGGADLPGGGRVEFFELETLFLELKAFDVAVDVHGAL